jgi:hypothetical protein
MMRTLAIIMILILAALRSPGAAAPATTRAATSNAGDRGPGRTNPADGAGANPEADELAGYRIPVAGPTVDAVLTAAYAAAGLDHDPADSWIRRARLAGLVPWVTVRTASDTSWQDDHSEVGHGTSIEVRATWRLDRLLFDNHELQVAGLEAARRRERRRLAARVIRAYFTWRRAAGVAFPADDDRVAIRVAETTAELDALTDGWFSEAVVRSERGTSETRPRRTPSP